MGTTVAVAGASGYAGGELLRLLSAHPGLDVGPLAASSAAGRRVAEVHPGLRSLADRVLGPTDASALAEADAVLLALPHGHSGALVAQLPADLPVVDLGADHRLADAAAWDRWYGGSPHAGTWVYGLPELPDRRAQVAATARVANPGCYPTAVALALAPLLAAGVAQAEDVVVVAASGTSGAGRAAKESLLGSQVMGDLAAYKVGGHSHVAEIAQTLTAAAGRRVHPSFTPVLAPLPRGILATCTAVAPAGTTTACVRALLREAYADEPFVSVLHDDAWPHTAATAGTNAVHLQAAVDVDAGRVVVVAAQDNLGKGAAGQAVQNLNLVLGLPETAGLTADAVAP